MGVLYILDEPSIGLHARDNERLLASLARLRDAGNTVVVVEHDEATIRARGPRDRHGAGRGHPRRRGGGGGHARGDRRATRARRPAPGSRARRAMPAPARAPGADARALVLVGCREHNLKRRDAVAIPLGRFTVVTGVSGSGKSTLVNDTLHRVLARKLHGARAVPGALRARARASSSVDKVIEIDQSPIGRTPRSNPATYTGAFDGIRKLFSAGARGARARLRRRAASPST